MRGAPCQFPQFAHFAVLVLVGDAVRSGAGGRDLSALGRVLRGGEVRERTSLLSLVSWVTFRMG